ELARASGQEPDRAYTLGLLHDIGRLGLLVGYPDAYQEILAEAGRDAVSLLDLEKRRFGMDHCEAGRLLMGEWGLPQAVLVATGRHHDPPQGGPFDMLHIVHLACRLADALGYFVAAPLQSVEFEELAAMLPAHARERFPRNRDALQQVVDGAIGEGDLAGPPHPAAPAPLATPAGPARHGSGEAGGARAASGPEKDWPDLDDQQIAWDLFVEAVTVAVFVTIMLGLKYFG
ncbi:MAG TPA: HDOD domain-containing protein, partial [Candidatus Acidoferrales bacterium]|nr:HDOD domain-containing protein [Candidatus Acidoferrales bacterium]